MPTINQLVRRRRRKRRKLSKAPVHVPLSGRTMSFDGSGKCVSGC